MGSERFPVRNLHTETLATAKSLVYLLTSVYVADKFLARDRWSHKDAISPKSAKKYSTQYFRGDLFQYTNSFFFRRKRYIPIYLWDKAPGQDFTRPKCFFVLQNPNSVTILQQKHR